jgi:regulator of replication initiation timing
MKVEISNGEILDKFSILEIKINRIKDEQKLQNVSKEIEELKPNVKALLNEGQIIKLYLELKNANETLWAIEDSIRNKERLKEFDEEFIQLARAVYLTNDKRADIKKQINNLTGSELIEEKSYEKY